MSLEESPRDVLSSLPQESASSSISGRGRAWLTLLFMLVVVFLIAWLLGFFNL